MMTLGTFCSGIGAPEQAGMGKPLWFCEIDPFPSAVLAHRFPCVPNLGDMTAPDLLERIAEIGLPDIIVAGLPCQPFSVAGLSKGLEDPRNLTVRFVELADAIDDLRRAAGQRPVWWCVENVPGLLSDANNAFGALLGGMVGDDAAIDRPAGGWTNAGVVAGPRRVAAWRVLDAQHFGVAQRRRRVFVLALGGAGAWACADALLPIADSLSGHPAPSREAGEDVAGMLAAGAHPSGFNGRDAERGNIVTHSLRAEGFDASEDGTGRGTPLVPVAFQTRGSNIDVGEIAGTMGSNADRASGSAPMIAFSCKDHGADAGDTASTLRAMGHSGSHANAGGQVAVAFDATQVTKRFRCNGCGFEMAMEHERCPCCLIPFDTTQITSPSNYSNPKPGDPCRQMAAVAHAPAIAFHARQDPDSGPVTHPLDTDGYSIGVAGADMAVRRLTVLECERLQGLPEVSEGVILSVCKDDKCPLFVNAETPCTTGPNGALSAEGCACRQPVKTAGHNFNISQADLDPPAVLHVLLRSERGEVEIRNAERCLWFARIADKPSTSPLHMPLDDFVRLVALTVQTSAGQIQLGKAVSRRVIEHSTPLWSGRRHVRLSGQEIAAHANAVAMSGETESARSTSIISPPTRNTPNEAQTLATLCCCVLTAIGSFIQQQTSTGCSFSVLIEERRGYTNIVYRGKPAADGPRYKAIGNSMAVPCMAYIGERIRAVAETTEAAA